MIFVCSIYVISILIEKLNEMLTEESLRKLLKEDYFPILGFAKIGTIIEWCN